MEGALAPLQRLAPRINSRADNMDIQVVQHHLRKGVITICRQEEGFRTVNNHFVFPVVHETVLTVQQRNMLVRNSLAQRTWTVAAAGQCHPPAPRPIEREPDDGLEGRCRTQAAHAFQVPSSGLRFGAVRIALQLISLEATHVCRAEPMLGSRAPRGIPAPDRTAAKRRLGSTGRDSGI